MSTILNSTLPIRCPKPTIRHGIKLSTYQILWYMYTIQLMKKLEFLASTSEVMLFYRLQWELQWERSQKTKYLKKIHFLIEFWQIWDYFIIVMWQSIYCKVVSKLDFCGWKCNFWQTHFFLENCCFQCNF